MYRELVTALDGHPRHWWLMCEVPVSVRKWVPKSTVAHKWVHGKATNCKRKRKSLGEERDDELIETEGVGKVDIVLCLEPHEGADAWHKVVMLEMDGSSHQPRYPDDWKAWDMQARNRDAKVDACMQQFEVPKCHCLVWKHDEPLEHVLAKLNALCE